MPAARSAALRNCSKAYASGHGMPRHAANESGACKLSRTRTIPLHAAIEWERGVGADAARRHGIASERDNSSAGRANGQVLQTSPLDVATE